MYVKHLLESISLRVELPMIFEMDNKWEVDLINNYSVAGRTHHMETSLAEGVKRAESDVV